MRKKNKRILFFSASIILLLIIALYVGTFETSDINLTGGTAYGVCLHLHQFTSSTTIQLIKKVNATWIRIDWIPNQMEEFVKTMRDYNVSILAILDHNTMNATYPNQNFTRLQWQTTIQNIMSTEAAKEVDAWEIWNEPNDEQFYLGYMNGNPENYFDMLKDTYQSIKAVSSNATVLSAGLSPYGSYSWKVWLTDFANMFPQRYFDFQGVHLYDDAEANQNILSETREIIGKDLWITEIGDPSGPRNQSFTPEDQAHFIESNFQMLRNKRIPVFWYQLKDEINAEPPKESYFGLFDFQDNPKPASEAFANFTYKP